MYLVVFTRTAGKSYRRRLGSLLLCLCDVFRALINSLGVWKQTNSPDHVESQLYSTAAQFALEQRENFLLQGELFVLTLISVSIPPPVTIALI